MIIDKTTHRRNNIDRLDVSRKERGREIASTEDYMNASMQRLHLKKAKKD